MKKNKPKNYEVALLSAGELIVGALTVLGYFIVSLIFEGVVFDYRVITGAVLGAAVIILNFLFLSISVNRAVDEFLTLRSTREMTEEEAEAFAAEHSMKIQNTIKTSFIIRTVTMLVALVVAFIVDVFNPIATAIPLLAFRPVLTVASTLARKFTPTPTPVCECEEKEVDVNGN